MKLVMNLLVRDGIEQIKDNLNFHLQLGVDHIVVTDNGSIDGTREVLSDYEKTGAVTVIDEPVQDFSQSKWMTRAALYAKENLRADWLLNNDVDEFWYPRSKNFKETILSLNADILVCQRKNMVFAYDEKSNINWKKKLRYRVTLPVQFTPPKDIYKDPIQDLYFYLALPPKVLTRTHKLVAIGMGNHSAQFSSPPKRLDADIDIFHYPILSTDHFIKKIKQGGAAYKKNHELEERIGWHWRRWYQLIQDGKTDIAIAEALPDLKRLTADINSGILEVDDTIFTHFQNC